MSSAGTLAGRAYLEIGTHIKPLVSGLSAAETRIRKFGQSVAGFGKGLGIIGTIASIPILKTIADASKATESMSAFTAVFGDQAQKAKEWADAWADATGRSATGTKEAMTSFMAFFRGLSIGGSESSKLSQDLVELGTDLASFRNLDDADAQQRLMSALSGSVESMDQFGIDLHAAALERELGKSLTKATEIEKVNARIRVIRKSLENQNAIGAAKREVNSPVGLWRKFNAMVERLSETFGAKLLPMLTRFGLIVLPMIETGIKWVEKNDSVVLSIVGIIAAVTGMGAALVAIGVAAGLAGTILGGLGGTIAFLVSPIGITTVAIIGLVAVVSGIGIAILTQTKIGAAAIEYLSKNFGWLHETATKTISGISKAVKAGNIKLAFEILGAGIEVAWSGTLQGLYSAWIAISLMIKGAIDELLVYTQKQMDNASLMATKFVNNATMGSFAGEANENAENQMATKHAFMDAAKNIKKEIDRNNADKDIVGSAFKTRHEFAKKEFDRLNGIADKLKPINPELPKPPDKLPDKPPVPEELKKKITAVDSATNQLAKVGSSDASSAIIRSMKFEDLNRDQLQAKYLAEIVEKTEKVIDKLDKIVDKKPIEVKQVK